MILFSNHASTRLTENIINNTNIVSVTPDSTSLFPTPVAVGDYFMLCIAADDGSYEIVKCTAKTTSTFTVERAQEGTTARAFSAGALVENRITAGSLTQLLNEHIASTTNSGTVRIASATEVENGTFNASDPAVCTPANIQTTIKNTVPNGTVVAFSGSFGGTDDKFPIPNGSSTPNTSWHICDGTANTPNLVDRFIMGSASSTAGTTGGSTTASAEVSATTLSMEQMPSHNHEYLNRVGSGSTNGYGENGAPGLVGTTWRGGSQPHSHMVTVATVPPYYKLAYIIKIA